MRFKDSMLYADAVDTRDESYKARILIKTKTHIKSDINPCLL